jgi:hypothetical protein
MLTHPQNQTQFPPLLSIDDLSRLIGKETSSIIADRSRRPEALPPDCTPETQKNPVWLLSVVLDWYASHQKPILVSKVAEVKQTSTKRLGAPTKAERIAKRLEQGGAK